MSHNFEKTDSMSEMSSLSVKSRISFIEEFKDFKKNRPKPVPIQTKPVKPPEKPTIPARKPPEIPDRCPKIPDRTERTPNGPSNIEENKNTDEKSASHKPKTPVQKPKGQTDNDLLSKDNYSEVNKYAYFRIEYRILAYLGR